MADHDTLTWRGTKLDPAELVAMVDRAFKAKAKAHERIRTVRDLRRREGTVALAPSWKQRHPEHSKWVVHVMPERNTLERDLKARLGAVEPVYSRAALDETQKADREAEALEDYAEEWRKSPHGPPVQTFFGKGTEDGEYGVTILPSPSDMDGKPEFFDTLSERAYAALGASERTSYKPWDGDQRRRYVKVDRKGGKRTNPAYDRDERGRSRKEAGEDFARDTDKSKDAHREAVRRYLLERQASNIRVVPALDCAPIYARGIGRERRKLIGLCEKATYDREELIDAGLTWVGLGDRALLPRADGSGSLTLYAVYLLAVDDEGKERTLVCYTVGGPGTSGVGTWYADSPPEREAQPASIAVIDLYEKYGLCGRFFGYFGGLRTDDDDAAYEYQPYLWPFVDLIRGLEGNKTAINAANAVNSFPGYLYTPDADLAEKDPDAVVDANDQLRHPQVPLAGEIVAAAGAVVPFAPAQVGQDAWRVFSADMAALQQATAVDQPAGGAASGHAQVVQATLAAVAKRDIRDGALAATIFAGECHLKILHAYAVDPDTDVRWPLATTSEPAAGEGGRPGLDVKEFDPDWLGEQVNARLSAEYPAEENLARIDLEANLAERGFGSFEDVQHARGKSDTLAERVKVMEDLIWRMPETQVEYAMKVAKLRQDPLALKVLKLRAGGQLTKSGVPGMEEGVPTSAITPGGGPFQGASRVRAGIQAGETGAAARTADAGAQMQVQPQAQQGAA